MIATRAKLAEAERADGEAARKAIKQGGAVPKAKATAIADKLAEGERELAVIGELVPESAQRLLVAAAPHAGRVAAEAEERADQLEQQALDDLAAVRETFAAANDLRGEAAWAQGLHESGIVRPWSSSRGPGEHERAVVEAITRIEHDRQRRVEHVAEMAREREAADAVSVAGQRQRPLEPSPSAAAWDPAAVGERESVA